MDWIFTIPQPNAGTLMGGYYNAGPMLACDRDGFTEEDSKMQIVTGVTLDDYNSYIATLTAAGLKKTAENTIGNNHFADFHPYHIAYFANRGEIRVTEDKATTPLTEFGYSAKGSMTTTVYQYGLYYDKHNDCTDTTVNCGMLYIIRLSDGSIVFMDGGHIYQWNETAMDALWSFICKITNLRDGEKVRIAAYYMTHAHDDHADGFTKLLNRHGDRIVVERVMFNTPSYQVKGSGYSETVFDMKKTVAEKYPDAKLLKVHSGQKFTLADAEFEFLYAHEDAAESDNITSFPFGDFNCTSSILRLTVDGKTVMFLGDTSSATEALMARTYTRDEWKSDCVQVAHHCFNYLRTLYDWIDAPLAMLPNSYFGGHTPENTPKLADVLAHLSGEDNIYYEGEATCGFAVIDGKWKMVSEEPVVGGEYDGSGF